MENIYMFCVLNSFDLILVKLLVACKAYALAAATEHAVACLREFVKHETSFRSLNFSGFL